MIWMFGGFLAIILFALLVRFWPVLRVAVYVLGTIWDGMLLLVGGKDVLGDPFILMVFFPAVGHRRDSLGDTRRGRDEGLSVRRLYGDGTFFGHGYTVQVVTWASVLRRLGF